MVRMRRPTFGLSADPLLGSRGQVIRVRAERGDPYVDAESGEIAGPGQDAVERRSPTQPMRSGASPTGNLSIPPTSAVASR